jgi:hypothetical protein
LPASPASDMRPFSHCKMSKNRAPACPAIAASAKAEAQPRHKPLSAFLVRHSFNDGGSLSQYYHSLMVIQVWIFKGTQSILPGAPNCACVKYGG